MDYKQICTMVLTPCWDWESADKSIQKQVLRDGHYNEKATEGSRCTIILDHVRINPDGISCADLIEKYHTEILIGNWNYHFHKEFVIGEASSEVDRKIERVVQTMNAYEKSRVVITLSRLDVTDENMEVRFQIVLTSCKLYKSIWECTPEEKYDIALKNKEKGVELCNYHFRYADAFYKFSKACKILITLEPIQDLKLDKQLESDINNLRLLLYNNMAECHLKLENFQHTITLCTKVLAKDENNVKALYRRGVAYGNMKDNEKSVADLKAALTLEPNNNIVKAQFRFYNTRLRKATQECNDMMKKMLKI